MATKKDWDELLAGAQDKDAGKRLAAWKKFSEAFQQELSQIKSRAKAASFYKPVQKLYPLALRALDNELRYVRDKYADVLGSLSFDSLVTAAEEAVRPFMLFMVLCELLDNIIVAAADCYKNFSTERLPQDWLEETLPIVKSLHELTMAAFTECPAKQIVLGKLEVLKQHISESMGAYNG